MITPHKNLVIEEGQIKPLKEIRWDQKVANYVRKTAPQEDRDCITSTIETLEKKEITANRAISSNDQEEKNWLYIDACNHILLIRVNPHNEGTFDGVRPQNDEWVLADR